MIPKPGATVISQEQSAELGYSSGYAGEKMVPLSDVMFPPQGTKNRRGNRERVYQWARNTIGHAH